MGSLRDQVKAISPPWLQGGRAERYVFTTVRQIDWTIEKLTQAIKMRFPSITDESALPAIGRDRVLPRGLTEMIASWRLRLQRAFDAWGLAAGNWGLLRETLHTLLAMTPAARVVSSRFNGSTYPSTVSHTTWASYDADADTEFPPEWKRVAPGNWIWDTLFPIHGSWGWHRIWVILYADEPNDWTHDATWLVGDESLSLGSIPGSIGLDCDPSVIDALLDKTEDWKGQHAELVSMIVSLDPTAFDPDDDFGSGGLPDGHFGRWSKMNSVGEQVSAREIDGARFCARSA